MFDRLRPPLLRLLRVPHDPDPPAGAPGSLRVFRAGKNFYQLRLARWAFGQLGALAGIVFSLFLLSKVELAVEANRNAAPPAPSLQPAAESASQDTVSRPTEKIAERGRIARHRGLERLAQRSPPWIWSVIRFFEFVGIVVYLIQIPITYAMVRLDYELRWYMVTDRSLRIRAGLATVQESTMSFANLQQVVVTQGPVQRALGLADLRVQSAGGGGRGPREESETDSLHTGVFHGVENATEIRDLILERLRLFRQAGLGDPDETAALPAAVLPAAPASTGPAPVVHEAARELLAAARTLRAPLSR
jgi:membrane protein YdbS with pleckstrin-like domain